MGGRVEIAGTTKVTDKIRVQHGFVAVALLEEEQEGLIYYTDKKDHKPNGRILVVGDDSWQGTKIGGYACRFLGIRKEINLTPGELVLLPKIGQQKFSVDGKEEFVVVHHEDVKVIFRDNKE